MKYGAMVPDPVRCPCACLGLLVFVYMHRAACTIRSGTTPIPVCLTIAPAPCLGALVFVCMQVPPNRSVLKGVLSRPLADTTEEVS